MRLWLATLALPCPLDDYLARYGFPIRYSYVPRAGPANITRRSTRPRWAAPRCPRRGAHSRPKLITRLIARGVQIAPLLLHTGVASLEDHEPPYEEYYRVPLATARVGQRDPRRASARGRRGHDGRARARNRDR